MSTWIPISGPGSRLPTSEDADERGEVVWKWAHGGKSSARFNSHPEDAVAWHPLPRYTPPKPGPTNTECANILHYSALACMNHLDPKMATNSWAGLAITYNSTSGNWIFYFYQSGTLTTDDVPLEEQFAMVRRWFADVTARIEREEEK